MGLGGCVRWRDRWESWGVEVEGETREVEGGMVVCECGVVLGGRKGKRGVGWTGSNRF